MLHKNYGQSLSEKLEKLLTDRDNVIPAPFGPGNLLGTFEKPNNKKIPAIYVGEIPSSWSTSGLQCIIGLLPTRSNSYHANNPDGYGTVGESGLWKFTLRQFPVAQSKPLVQSEQMEFLDSTIELAHARIMSWASDIQMQSQTDNSKATVYQEAIYLIPYDWRYKSLLGKAGPYV